MHGDTDKAMPFENEASLPVAGRPPFRLQLHGTTIAIKPGADRAWVAALIRGASGSGKSDLALRCLAQPLGSLSPGLVEQSGVRLVADDRTDVSVGGHDRVFLTASGPSSIAGLLEVRGLGILAVPHIASARLMLVIDLVPPLDVPRFPLPTTTTLIGPAGKCAAIIPQILLTPFEASSPLKVILALIRMAHTGSPNVSDAVKHHHLPEGQ